jgi:CRISPR system Cascade subunit CasD
MRVLLMRFAAPLMSFGAVRVDARGPINDHPGLGLVTGLLGNALGYDHAEADRLTRLQERLRLASRCDQTGEQHQDYQTVDLGLPGMAEGWTTRGAVEGRKGGSASEGTHIRFRQFHAGRVQTVAVALAPADEAPTVDELAAALDAPARPLFIGRKPCLPATRLNLGVVTADTLLAALAAAPRWSHGRSADPAAVLNAWWPEDPTVTPPVHSRVEAVVDERDWRGQVVVGRRLVRSGHLTLTEAAHG